MIANEQVEAYVGSKWGSWELAGPPANPPSGDSMCNSVETALRERISETVSTRR
jgi:hypothetical protein